MPRSQGTSRKGKPKKGERAAGMGRALQKAQRVGGGNRGGGGGGKINMAGGMSVSGGISAPSTSLGSPLMDQAEKNTMSLLEMDHLDDFLVQAEMAGREFESEKARFVVLDSHGAAYQPGQRQVQWQDKQTSTEAAISTQVHQFSFEELSVPRRPKWDETTTPEELEKLENDSFLAWRRSLASREESLFSDSNEQQQQQQHAYFSKTVTPYEKNLQVWRQLWRVLERCSCVVQLVDARNPLFYLSEDLRKYAAELGKPMMLLVNKGDYLSSEQRRLWSQYLAERNWDHVFFSAHIEQAKLDKAAHAAAETQEESGPLPDGDESESENEIESENESEKNTTSKDATDDSEPIGDAPDGDESEKEKNTTSKDSTDESEPIVLSHGEQRNNGVDRLLTREELMNWMHDFATKKGCKPNPRYENRIQFGTVGFPNVGKSSVINVLMGSSKNTHGMARVAVAAQPGKTKHFQTLLLSNDMMLCDCPGLVFPSFVSNTADLIAAGVYPIAQMRDHWPVIELICKRIPREIINASYGIKIPEPSFQELNERGLKKIPPPTGDEFLSTYCVARSMLAASSGVPDYTRAARIVIKDYVSGKLLYCHPPPNAKDTGAFHLETVKTAVSNTEKLRQKFLANQTLQQENNYGETHGTTDIDNEESFDRNILDILGDSTTTSGAEGEGGKRGKAHGTKKRWGKKGKKLRDKDPYGCHADPDEMLAKTTAAGVTVKAGKYGKSGYTRPQSYAGARSALYASSTN